MGEQPPEREPDSETMKDAEPVEDEQAGERDVFGMLPIVPKPYKPSQAQLKAEAEASMFLFVGERLRLTAFVTERKEAVLAFRAFLKQLTKLHGESRWSRFREDYSKEPTYLALSDADAETVFRQYIKELAEVEERARREDRKRQEREREDRERRMKLERQRRDTAEREFDVMLREAITDPWQPWTKQARRLNERFELSRESALALPEPDRERMYRTYCSRLMDVRTVLFVFVRC